MKKKLSVITMALAAGTALSVSLAVVSASVKNVSSNETNNAADTVIINSSPAQNNENQLSAEIPENIQKSDEHLTAQQNVGIIRAMDNAASYMELELHSDDIKTCTMDDIDRILDDGIKAYYNGNGSPLLDRNKYISDTEGKYSMRASKSTLEAKSYIYHMMLNSVDYFNTAEGSVTIATSIDSPYTQYFQTDIPEQTAYKYGECLCQKIEEVFISDGIEYDVNLVNGTYTSLYAATLSDHIINDNDRVMILDDGNYIVTNRNNITNLGDAASCCLFPQSYATSHLSTFANWDITGNETILDRNCAVMEGTHESYNFKMYIDINTGIMLKYEKFDLNGNLLGYNEATALSLDKDIDIKRFDSSHYETEDSN